MPAPNSSPKPHKYADFKPSLDAVLAKLSPEDYQAFDSAMRSLWAGHQYRDQKKVTQSDIDAQWVLINKLGLSNVEARGLVGLASGVMFKPDEPVTEAQMAKKSMFDIIPERKGYSKFDTDSDFISAVLQSYGLAPEFYVPTPENQSPGEAGAQDAATAEAGKQKDVRAQMQAFIDSLTGPSAPNDPVRMALTQAGIDAAQKSAGAGGLRGTLAQTQAASVAQQNVLPYEAQRQQLRGQALGALGNYELSGQQLAQQQAQFEQQRQDIIAENKWKGEQNQGQGMWGTIGAIGGGIIGAYAGGPQGAMMGAQLGSSALGGMASAGQPSSPNYQTRQPSSLSRRGSGGSGTGY